MMSLSASIYNVFIVGFYVLCLLIIHLRIRLWWVTLLAALSAITVDGLLIPFGAVIVGSISLFCGSSR
ncbi:MAG: hypothetical protein EDR02_18560 [Actinobacteria bacterium]|nr:MAG: hypothetical protein EDR02_18560 [Actinomycetota bacterium]